MTSPGTATFASLETQSTSDLPFALGEAPGCCSTGYPVPFGGRPAALGGTRVSLSLAVGVLGFPQMLAAVALVGRSLSIIRERFPAHRPEPGPCRLW